MGEMDEEYMWAYMDNKHVCGHKGGTRSGMAKSTQQMKTKIARKFRDLEVCVLGILGV